MRKIEPIVGAIVFAWLVITVGGIWVLEQHANDMVYYLF